MRRSLLPYRLAVVPVFVLALAPGHARERPTVVKGPRAILLYGGPLAAPVVVQTRAATSLFLRALAPDTATAAADTIRGSGTSGTVSVAIFWSPRPFGLPEDTLPAAAYQPLEAADQRGRLYPARGGAPALLVLDVGTGFPSVRRRVTAKAARMLVERGAPVALLLP